MVWLILGIYLGAKFQAKLMPIVTTIDRFLVRGGEEKHHERKRCGEAAALSLEGD